MENAFLGGVVGSAGYLVGCAGYEGVGGCILIVF